MFSLWWNSTGGRKPLGGRASSAGAGSSKVLGHKTALFDSLTERWKTLFDTKFEVLLYGLTSTRFESEPPFPEGDKRKFGDSRDKRSDVTIQAPEW